jgi:hypothetical protein
VTRECEESTNESWRQNDPGPVTSMSALSNASNRRMMRVQVPVAGNSG